MDSDTAAEVLAKAGNALAMIEAPAGCGKTYAIAKAVALSENRRQLILTHTNAGVSSLRAKLRRFGVPQSNYSIDTIDGWALRLAACFPGSSGYMDDMSWVEIRNAALRVLEKGFARQLITDTHQGLYVDEYQDCSALQHQIVLRLAEMMPCRVLGDPLQSVFGFAKDDKVVDWKNDVEANFTGLGVLDVPWRWKCDGSDPRLGNWLLSVRDNLFSNKAIDIPTPFVHWVRSTDTLASEIGVCRANLNTTGSTVAICSVANRAHNLASSLGGTYQSMEEMECKALLSFARSIWNTNGVARALATIKLAKACFIGTSGVLGPLEKSLQKGHSLTTTSKKPDVQRITKAVVSVVDNSSLGSVREALAEMEGIEGVKSKRRELWQESMRTLDLYLGNPNGFSDLVEAARKVRERTRIVGRRPEFRTLSRVLLIKGLEFDNAIVVDTDALTAKELYVALSRARQSLTVISKSSTISPKIEPVKKAKQADVEPVQLTLLDSW